MAIMSTQFAAAIDHSCPIGDKTTYIRSYLAALLKMASAKMEPIWYPSETSWNDHSQITTKSSRFWSYLGI